MAAAAIAIKRERSRRAEMMGPWDKALEVVLERKATAQEMRESPDHMNEHAREPKFRLPVSHLVDGMVQSRMMRGCLLYTIVFA